MKVVNVPAEPCSNCWEPITDKHWYEAGCGCSWHLECRLEESGDWNKPGARPTGTAAREAKAKAARFHQERDVAGRAVAS